MANILVMNNDNYETSDDDEDHDRSYRMQNVLPAWVLSILMMTMTTKMTNNYGYRNIVLVMVLPEWLL